MFVYARHQPQAYCSSDGFGHLALVDGSQAGQVGMLYPAHVGHIVRHDGEILIEAEWIDVQLVEDVGCRSFPLLPFSGLCGAQVVRSVHIARGPSAPELSFNCSLFFFDLLGLSRCQERGRRKRSCCGFWYIVSRKIRSQAR